MGIVEKISELMRLEQRQRDALRATTKKLAMIRMALGMGDVETPDYSDCENPNPYVSIGELVVGVVQAAGRPVSVREVRAALEPVLPLTSQQAGMALSHAARRHRTIVHSGRGLYQALPVTSVEQPSGDSEGRGEDRDVQR